MLRIRLYVLFVVTNIIVCYGMTREQLKKTLTVMKKQCMPKHGVTNEEVDNIEQGGFVAEHKVMCYIACIYKTIQVVKNGRLNKDLISKQVDILYPQELKATVKKNAAICLEIQTNYDDWCEGIFFAAKCLYEADPTSFIFP